MAVGDSPTQYSPERDGTQSTNDGRQRKSRSGHLVPSSSLLLPETASGMTSISGRKESTGLAMRRIPEISATKVKSLLSHWTSIFLMIFLIFGGCCANVFALEAIIKDRPSSGPLITFAQFILTALLMSPDFFSLSSGSRSLFLRRRCVPLQSWLIYTAFFVTVNLLNNWAFAYRISVPLHIILRSGGPVASMTVGYIYAGRKYSSGQVVAVSLLTLGVVTSALADAQAKGQSVRLEVEGNSSVINTLVGFAILALAMLLSAFQGIYADRLYETYGRNHWKEALFYSHILSLPIFFPTFSQLLSQWRALNSSPTLLSYAAANLGPNEDMSLACGDTVGQLGSCALHSSSSAPINALSQILLSCHDNGYLQSILANVPIQVIFLLLNALTQYWCIRGVHLLSAKSSSLTVTIVLNIRKLVSLLLSMRLFGNSLSLGVLLGAALVFTGGALYGFEGARLRGAANNKRD